MPPLPALPPQVDQALARGWTVLTANQRAARTLRHSFDRRQQALQLESWHPPAILAWDTWTASLWHRLLLDGNASALLLNPTQEHTLWRAILASDRDATSASSSLRPLDSLAELAANAWAAMHAYRGRRRLRASADSADTRAFERWASEFERRCERANYLSAAQLPETLRASIASGQTSLGANVPGLVLVGFDTKTPAQIALIESVRQAGVEIEDAQLELYASSTRYGASQSSSVRSLVASPAEYDELAACAAWMRSHLLASPDAHLAVIVPDLDAARAEIDRSFRHILAPELEAIAAPTGSGPFEFSLGVPLAQTALVATALDILRWAVAPLSLDRLSALLLSPHFGSGNTATDATKAGTEYLARAEFDAFVLRRQHLLQPQVSLDALLDLAAHAKLRLPLLLHHLRNLRLVLSRREFTSGDRSYSDWAATIHDLLDAAGWAGGGGDNSIEFQTRQRWESALDELATLDFDASRVRFEEALRALERIAAQTLFAPESRRAPIQIMGPLESAGSTFDGIWFLRAGALTWPVTAAPNPLLPWRLQRELGMPGVDPALDSAHAQRVTERIAASAPKIFFSYAQETADGNQRPSSTLAALALEPFKATQAIPQLPLREAIALEASAEPLIPPPPDRLLQGGASILQTQAACGFRAFAEKRLFSSALDARDLGLDPGERGSLVHEVLHSFWEQVETQAALQQLSNDERDATLLNSIRQTLAKHISASGHSWNRAYLDIEQRRLVNLLTPWLEYERDKRNPFRVRAREEKLKNVQIGPLHIDIRVDRIDTHLVDGDAGGDIILDYKTGVAKTADWLGDRPDAPQLPLYAVVSESPQLEGVAFASIRAGRNVDLTGYESRSGVLPKASRLKTYSLDAQVEEWRVVLTSLAEAFHSGDAAVEPKQYPSTCRFCHQRMLCRLDVSTLEADAIEELAEGDSADDFAEADRG